MVKRVHGWPLILAQKVREARDTPFVWGEHDCALFAADTVLAMTGEDFAEQFRGTYSTALGAEKALRKAGFDSLWAYATHCFGTPLQDTLTARRGDLVLVETTNGPALSICFGPSAAAAGADGLVFLPTSHWVSAWRVG